MRVLALLAAAATTLLAACSGPLDPNHAIVGIWGDEGTHCAQGLVFGGDGTFQYEGRSGHWKLQNDQLTLSGGGGTSTAALKWIDRDHMRLTRPDGSTGVSERCK